LNVELKLQKKIKKVNRSKSVQNWRFEGGGSKKKNRD